MQNHPQHPIMLKAAVDFIQANPHAGWSVKIDSGGNIDPNSSSPRDAQQLLSAVANSTRAEPDPGAGGAAIRDALDSLAELTNNSMNQAARALSDFAQKHQLELQTQQARQEWTAQIKDTLACTNREIPSLHLHTGRGSDEKEALADLARQLQDQWLVSSKEYSDDRWQMQVPHLLAIPEKGEETR